MGKQGSRKVLIRADDAVVAARWLRNVAIPSMRSARGSILGGDLLGIDLQSLELLAGEFTRKAGRKRPKAEFSALVSVADAAAFSRAVDRCRPCWPLSYDPALIRLAEAMRDGGQSKRRGRRWLSEEALQARVTGKFSLDERHRLRLAARSRKSDAWCEWIGGVMARGQTVLTADLRPSKI
jgi:hypothetical protein